MYDSIPATSDAVPIVGSVFMFILVLCGLTLFFTFIILNISASAGASVHDVPYFVRVYINQYLAALFFVGGEQKRWKNLFFCLKTICSKSSKEAFMSPVQNGGNTELLMRESNGVDGYQNCNVQVNVSVNRNGNNVSQQQSFTSSAKVEAHNSTCQDIICRKFMKEEEEKECRAEWAKCARVIDRIFMIGLLVVLGGTMFHFLSMPERLIVP